MKYRSRVSVLFRPGKYRNAGISPVIDVQRADQGSIMLDIQKNGAAGANVPVNLLASSDGQDFYSVGSLGCFDSDIHRAIPLRDIGFRFLRIGYEIAPKDTDVHLKAELITKNFFDDFRYDIRDRKPLTEQDRKRRQLGNRIHQEARRGS